MLTFTVIFKVRNKEHKSTLQYVVLSSSSWSSTFSVFFIVDGGNPSFVMWPGALVTAFWSRQKKVSECSFFSVRTGPLDLSRLKLWPACCKLLNRKQHQFYRELPEHLYHCFLFFLFFSFFFFFFTWLKPIPQRLWCWISRVSDVIRTKRLPPQYSPGLCAAGAQQSQRREAVEGLSMSWDPGFLQWASLQHDKHNGSHLET